VADEIDSAGRFAVHGCSDETYKRMILSQVEKAEW